MASQTVVAAIPESFTDDMKHKYPTIQISELLNRINNSKCSHKKMYIMAELFTFLLCKQEYMLNTTNAESYKKFATTACDKCRELANNPRIQENEALMHLLQQVITAYSE